MEYRVLYKTSLLQRYDRARRFRSARPHGPPFSASVFSRATGAFTPRFFPAGSSAGKGKQLIRLRAANPRTTVSFLSLSFSQYCTLIRSTAQRTIGNRIRETKIRFSGKQTARHHNCLLVSLNVSLTPKNKRQENNRTAT